MMLTAILILTTLVTMLALALVLGARRFAASPDDTVVEQINALLPQTQCGQCTYPGCRPYAQAIFDGQAPINQCPPGGTATIELLAKLLGKPVLPLNPDHGLEARPKTAFIHEDICIGCKKCILACPVDAIVGAAKKMHTVIASECTGCDLCIEPCPVDCIDMIPLPLSMLVQRPVKPAALAL